MKKTEDQTRNAGVANALYYAGLSLLLKMGAKRLIHKVSANRMELDPHDLRAQILWLRSRDLIDGTSILEDINRDLRSRFCPRPFEWFEFSTEKLYVCCPAWLPSPIAGIEDPSAAWSSNEVEKIRKSILDKSFRYCSRVYCPHIVNGTLPRDEGTKRVEPKPSMINLCNDVSCDLSCPSCRTKPIAAKGAERATLDEYFKTRISPLISSGCVVNITGSGDPFASKHFRSVIKALVKRPDVKLDLQSNGNLFDRRAWEHLNLAGHVRRVWISLDSADEATYAHLRRGGRLGTVLKNLRFLSELRRAEQIDFLGIDVVLQARNLDEVEDLVKVARTIGVDKIRFNMIRNWGSFSAEEFARENVVTDSSMQRSKFMKMFAAGVFHDPIVDRGNISQFAMRVFKPAEEDGRGVLNT